MSVPLRAALTRDGRLASLGPVLVLALTLFAYRALFLNALRVPEAYEVERWFFAYDEKAPLLVIAIAGWLLWRRRARWEALPARRDAVTAAALGIVGTGLFVWAHLARAADLLLPSLAANGLAFAAALKGRPGCRTVLLPALVLLLAVPIPAPLRDELVWRLQGWTAQGAARVMQALGMEVVREGIVFRLGEQTFVVIDACSGLRGIENLTILAILVRELFAFSGARQWLLLLLAPPLGFALNLARVVLVASSADPQALASEADHTPQGVAIMLVGTAILYAAGAALARGEPERAATTRRPAGDARGVPLAAWGLAAGCLAALAAVSLAAPALAHPAPDPSRSLPSRFPAQEAGWSSEEISPDRYFLGAPPREWTVYRRYRRERRAGPPQVVELFAALEEPGSPASTRLFTSKLTLPGAFWSREESRTARLWLLGQDAERSLASLPRASKLALVYTWRLRDEGLWRETWRSLLALEAGPFGRERPRAIVRLVTPVRGLNETALDRGKQTIEAFVRDFREELAGL